VAGTRTRTRGNRPATVAPPTPSPRTSPLRTPADAARLFANCTRLKSELFGLGGASIETLLDPPHAPRASASAADDDVSIGARTVVQPDGDVVCLVDPQCLTYIALRQAHADQALAWFEGLEMTVTTATMALRRSLAALTALIVVVAGLRTWQTANVTSGIISLAIATVGAAALHLGMHAAVGHTLGGPVRRSKASTSGQTNVTSSKRTSFGQVML
jgi:hypothetical protein